MNPQTAQAVTTALQFLGGMSSFHLTASADFDRDGGFGEEFRPQINIESRSINAAFDIFYQGRLGSNFGSFPLSRVGTGINYYPTGLALQQTVLDNGVRFSSNRFAPFLTGQLAFTTISVTDLATSSSFNALTVAYQVGGGGEIPITPTCSAVVEFLYEKTLLGGSASATGGTALTYSAYNGLIGISYHP